MVASGLMGGKYRESSWMGVENQHGVKPLPWYDFPLI